MVGTCRGGDAAKERCILAFPCIQNQMFAHLDTWLLSLLTGNLPTPIPKVFPIRPGTQGQEQEQARKEEGRQVKGQLQAFRCEERDFEKGGPEGQGFG